MRRLLQRLGHRPYAVVGRPFIEPCVERIMFHLERAEYAQVDALMLQASHENLNAILWGLAERRKVRKHAARWIARMPESKHATLLLGFTEIGHAWEIRGESYYKDISWLRRRRFQKVMESGYQRLFQLSQRDPGSVLAFAGMIHCSVVIGIGEEQREEWLEHVMEVVPFHLPTLINYAFGTKARWGGSEEEMVGFALWVIEHAPAGHMAHVIMAEAALELAFSVSDQYMDVVRLRREVQGDELAGWTRRALLSWLDVTPDQLHHRLANFDAEQEDGYARAVLERFALASYFAGALDEARMLLTALKGRISRDPWEQFSFSGSRLDKWTGMDKAYMGVTHDRVCRDLGLDLQKLCW